MITKNQQIVPSRRLLRVAIPLAMLGLFACASIGSACNIPVFRYALERWKPDECEVIVFYHSTIDQQQQQVVEKLRASTVSQGGHANAKVTLVNVSSSDSDTSDSDTSDSDTSDSEDLLDLWNNLNESANTKLPHVVVRTRLGRGQYVNHWHGSLTAAGQLGLYQSPLRNQIRERLLAGHSVVWLMVRSDDDQRNQDAKNIVESAFKTLVSKVKLPEGIGLPGSELYADVPLVLRFSLLEINPQDTRESYATDLITGLRQQAFADGEPLLVPVFGRGRALEVIPAGDLSPRLIEQLTVFLCGACSCQVKEQNPGFDLLIDADWDGELFGDEENRPPDRSELEGKNRRPVLVPVPPGRK